MKTSRAVARLVAVALSLSASAANAANAASAASAEESVLLTPPPKDPPPPTEPPPSAPTASPRTEETVPSGEPSADYDTRRYEPAGFPLIGGNSDIGFEFGVVGTLTKFGGGTKPYVWNLDLVLAASIKNAPGGGAELAQQKYSLQLDVPRVTSSIRTTPLVSFAQTINAPYFGRGNANVAAIPERVDGERGRFFQFLSREGRFRAPTRFTLSAPYYWMIAPTLRYEAPSSYPGSRLALDASTREPGASAIRGLHPGTVASIGTGLVIDSRDNEFFPRSGVFHQIGVRYVEGFPLDGDIEYGGAGVNLAGYVPLGGPFVFAARGVVDLAFGKIPFYDLFMGGPFNAVELPGGPNGIRGVPIGRYSGPVKVVANAELRAMLLGFKLLDQRFRLGANTFIDGGRIFDDYSLRAPRDGKGIGLKYGAGGGVYVQWGDAAVFRIELAYSPDAVAENPGFPFGLYVEDGVMF